MKKNISFHEEKYFFSRKKEFLFMKIICGRQFLYPAYWLIITAERAALISLTSPDSRPINVCVAYLT